MSEQAFIEGTRLRLRFEVPKNGTINANGLTTEDLWRLPMTSQHVNLRIMELALLEKLDKVHKGSFEEVLPEDEMNKLRLQILQHVILTRQKEIREKATLAHNEREFMEEQEILRKEKLRRKHTKLADLSDEELDKKLNTTGEK